MNNFEKEAKGAVLDLNGDDDGSNRSKKNQMRWDARKKKYVRADLVSSHCAPLYIPLAEVTGGGGGSRLR
jgi:hypothetical protein